MFEAAMYSFVFLWTMAMSPNGEAIKHGLIFVNFMTSSMFGSFMAGVLMKRARPESYMKVVFGIATVALSVPLVMALDTTEHPGAPRVCVCVCVCACACVCVWVRVVIHVGVCERRHAQTLTIAFGVV
jgi:hypothetical protein